MKILSYLSPCCGVLAARFLNLTKFECSHRRYALTYTHDIFHNKCKRRHHAKIFRLLLNKGVHIPYLCSWRWYRIKPVSKNGKYPLIYSWIDLNFRVHALHGWLISLLGVWVRVAVSTQILSTSTSTSTLLSMSTSMSTSTEKMCEYEYEYFSLSTSTSTST